MTKNTPVIKDWLLLGAGSGIVLSVAGEAVNSIIEKKGFPTIRYSAMASGFVLGKKAKFGLIPSQPANKAEWTIGWVSHAVIGALFGACLSYTYNMTPPGNNALKGSLGGALYWIATIAIGHQLKLANLAHIKPINMGTTLALTTIFGAVQGPIIGKYGAKAITQSHPVIVTNMDSTQFDNRRLSVSFPDRYRYQ